VSHGGGTPSAEEQAAAAPQTKGDPHDSDMITCTDLFTYVSADMQSQDTWSHCVQSG